MSLEAMKMALETLERLDRWLALRYGNELTPPEREVVKALRQAIEQAEKRNCDNCESLRWAAAERINELELELFKDKWVGLTDEEMRNLKQKSVDDGMTRVVSDFEYIRAIEAKLKEKNT
jgi:hypothetical protein